MAFLDTNTKELQSIRTWFNILNWAMLPNFGYCHTDDEKTFFDNYYVSPELIVLYENLSITMENRKNSAYIRILGYPGAGKTSFLYALKNMSQSPKEKVLSKYSFYIFHINKAGDTTPDTESYKTEILHNIKEAWKQFYYECNQIAMYNRFKRTAKGLKDRLNKLNDFYKENKKLFHKTLVFAIDDVDLLPASHVTVVVDFVIRNLEIASVKKWIVLRGNTFENYDGKTKTKIEQFFPDHYLFPNVPLHEIIDHRIKAAQYPRHLNKNAPINPFSKELCANTVSPLCDWNLRECLSILKSILEENPPKGINENTAPEFLHNYLGRVAVRTLLNANKLINIHSDQFRIGFIPLAADILGCSLHHPSSAIVFGALHDCLNERNINSGKPLGASGKELKVRESDFKKVVKVLEDHDLIRTKNSGDEISITHRGKMVFRVATTSDLYEDHCRSATIISGDSDIYWALSRSKLPYEAIVSAYMLWRKTHGYSDS